jgi:hypothetical protein
VIYCIWMRRQITESQALWAIIVLIIVIDTLWAWSLGIRIAQSPFVVFSFFLISGINFVYAKLRPDRRIAVFAAAAAQLTAFTACGAILSYLTVTSRFPLIDRYLAAADAAMGFDWRLLFMWVHEHPAIDSVLALSYGTGLFQIGVLLVVLNVVGQLERVREFVWPFVITLLIAVPVSWLFPAESAWVYFGVTNLTNPYHLADFTALRAGQMREISIARVNGLITFPSFHAALGLILIYASRGIRVLFPLSLGSNALMIASTPFAGGHYLVDILAGLAMVPLAVFILRSWQREPSGRLVAAVDSMSPMRER